MASRFRSLSEALRTQLKDNPPVTQVPSGSPLAPMFSIVQVTIPSPTEAVLRWGFSTWGIEPVTGYLFPNVLATPPTD